MACGIDAECARLNFWLIDLFACAMVFSLCSADGVLFNEIEPELPQYIRRPEASVQTIVNQMLENYNRHEIPRKQLLLEGSDKSNGSMTTPPLLVDVNMYVYSFSSISVVDMDYTIDFLLRQRWQDDRLNFLYPTDEKRKPISYLKNQLWLPDLFFRNAKSGFLHTITKPNYLIWLDDHGVITFSQKLSLKVSCHMTLEKFPMDTQSCKVNIGSYGYAIDYLDFRWWRSDIYDPTDSVRTNKSAKNAIEIRSDLEINEFSLISYDAYYCQMQYSSTGQFSCLEVKFNLQRRFGFYLIYAYLPSMLIVVIAWVSFLLDSSAVPARVSIGLLCVLALITQSAAILTQLPRVSYVKAIDIWVFICLAFVVSSLLEFAAANTIARRQARRKAKLHGLEKGLEVVTTLSALHALIEKSAISSERHKTGNELLEERLEESRALNPTQRLTVRSTNDQVEIPAENRTITNTSAQPGRVLCKPDCPCKRPSRVHRLDLAFAIGYPILFVMFNIFYWTYYVYYKRKSAVL